MTARYLSLLTLALGFTTASCSGDKDADNGDDDDDTQTDDDDDDTEETAGDTSEDVDPPALLDSYSYYFQFGYDQASGALVSATEGDSTYRPMFLVEFYSYDPSSNSLDPNAYCSIAVFLESGTFAPWVAADPDVEIYYGIDVLPTDFETDCTADMFDPAYAPLIDQFTDPTIPIGVGVGPMSDEIIAIFTTEAIVTDETFLGGYYNLPAIYTTPMFTEAYAFAAEVDVDWELVVVGTELAYLPATDVVPGANGIPTAFYYSSTFYTYVP